MKENFIITMASKLSKLLLLLCGLFLLLFLIIFVHWHFDADTYSNVIFINSHQSGSSIGNLKFLIGDAQPGPNDLVLRDMHPMMMYWLLVRTILFFGLTIAIIVHIIRLLTAIREIDTFYQGNIDHFQKMAKLGFVVFFLSCFNLSYINDTADFHFSIAFGPLLFSIACLVMAEVFKVGKQLLEDKNMIV